MKRLDKLCTSKLAAWTLLTLLLAFTLVSPYLPHTVLHAQSVGPGGVPGQAAGSAVSSVFTRTGAVVAATGDYSASQVTNAAATNAANTFSQNTTQAANTGTEYLNGQSNGHSFYLYANQSSSFNSLNFYDEIYGGNWGALASYTSGGPIGFYVISTAGYSWSSQSGNAAAAADTSLTRPSAGVIDCGGATSFSTTCTFNAATISAGTDVATPNLTLGGVPVTQAATAPESGAACAAIAWVLSNDGHITFCNGTTYVTKV